MTLLLFPDYLESEEAFDACSEFWRQQIARIAESVGQPDEWHHWDTNRYANGLLFERDLRSVYVARSARLDRALHIQQHPPDLHLNDAGTGAWVEVNGPEWDHTVMPKYDLFVSLVLSEESLEVVDPLLKMWMADASVDATRAYIREHLGDGL